MVLHALLSGHFSREIVSFYTGKNEFKSKQIEGNEELLRRCIHRIEKGLIQKPMRVPFGLSYLDQTVKEYIKYRQRPIEQQDHKNLSWYNDVLNEYFNKMDHHPSVQQAEEKFKSIEPVTLTQSHPMARKDFPQAKITFEEFFKLSRQRRSVRWFKSDPVPRELVDQAITAAAQAPSACNRQPFHFHIFDQAEKVQEIASIPMGTSGFSHQFPMIIVLVGDQSAYCETRDRHLIYIDGSLAAMSFMLALETLGLSSCPINWPDIEEKERKMDKLLKLKPFQRPIMLIAVGYADSSSLVPFSAKKSISSLRSYYET